MLRALHARRDLEVAVWASRAPRGCPDPLDALGWPVRSSGLPSRLLVAAWGRGLVAAPPGARVVHAVSLAVPPVREAGRALTVTVHDLAWRHELAATTPRGRRWHEGALRRALERANHLVVPSPPEAAGADRAQVAVVPWGADHLAEPDEASARRLLARAGVSGAFLLAVGTREPRKNLPRLLRAYRAARPSLCEPWPLVVAGPVGWGRDALGARAEGVVALGPVSEPVLSALYRQARMLAYFPLLEGFGFPPVEALASGLPCAASAAVPSLALAEGPEPVAVLADPADEDQMAEALVSVATDEQLRGRLQRAGQAFAGRLRWSATAAAYAEVWRSVA